MAYIQTTDEPIRYPIPPDLTMGRYVGGYTVAEITVIGVLALLALANLSITKQWSALTLAAIPAALAVLLHRRDNGFGYVNAARTLWVQVRYALADNWGTERFSLRRHLQLEQRWPHPDGEPEIEVEMVAAPATGVLAGEETSDEHTEITPRETTAV